MSEAESTPSATSNENHENEIELSQVIIVPNKEHLCSLEERIKKSPKLLKSRAAEKSCSIFRVPHNILDLHPRSFQPGIVSIGPYYHGEVRLEMMEEHKCRILGLFLHQLQEASIEIVLDDLYQALQNEEDKIRSCYSQNIDKYSTCELIEMMIVDSCFIIELLCVVGRIIIPESEDPIFNFPWMLSSITRDLLMLENQIPFFVLQILYDKAVADHTEVAPLQELILELINLSLPRYSKVSKLCAKYKSFSGEHILDFYRSTYIPPSVTGGDDQEKTTLWFWLCWLCSLRKEKNARVDSLRALSKEDTANDTDPLLPSSNRETVATDRRNSRNGENMDLENSLESSSRKEEPTDQGDSLELVSQNEETTADQGDALELLSQNEETADQGDESLEGLSKNKETEDKGDQSSKLLSEKKETADEGDSLEELSENEETQDVDIEEPRGFKKWAKKLCGLVGIQLKENTETAEDLLQFIQPVEKLLQAGIKFKKREDTDSFLDIDFGHGALRIPLLVTGETMSTLILNCIVFEQCYKHRSKHFISYFNFMGYLINTTFDAGYLREKKIIENFFGTDQELVNFFNEVGKNIPYYFKEDYLMTVARKVEIYYRNAWHVGWAEFKYTYCGSVWVCLSASAALLVILLTALQTFYAVYAYHNPSG